ncbi:hypothetical protein EDD86DRAFT_246168 [Gorgonomyces haynaldii]|nr:hypothetical protein EDD86DRAFT_246168 [Gorgonomyces haynaldii]
MLWMGERQLFDHQARTRISRHLTFVDTVTQESGTVVGVYGLDRATVHNGRVFLVDSNTKILNMDCTAVEHRIDGLLVEARDSPWCVFGTLDGILILDLETGFEKRLVSQLHHPYIKHQRAYCHKNSLISITDQFVTLYTLPEMKTVWRLLLKGATQAVMNDTFVYVIVSQETTHLLALGVQDGSIQRIVPVDQLTDRFSIIHLTCFDSHVLVDLETSMLLLDLHLNLAAILKNTCVLIGSTLAKIQDQSLVFCIKNGFQQLEMLPKPFLVCSHGSIPECYSFIPFQFQ